MRKVRQGSRLLAVLLVLILALGLLPMSSLAAGDADINVIVAVDSYDGWKIVYPEAAGTTEKSVSYAGTDLTALDVVVALDSSVTSTTLTSNRPTTFLGYARATNGYGNWSARKTSNNGTSYTTISNFTTSTVADGDSIIIYLPFSNNSAAPTWAALEPLITSPNPVRTPEQRLADTLNAALSWDAIKGQNTSQDNVTANLTIPSYLEGSSSSFAGFTVKWTSSDPTVAYTGSSSVYFTRPAHGEPDAVVTLTATVSRGAAGYYDPVKYPADFQTTTRTFTLTVKAITDEEFATVTPDQMDSVQYALDHMIDNIRLTAGTAPLDLDNVTGNIQLQDPYSVYDPAKGTTSRPDSVMTDSWSSDNPSVISINYLAATVTRPGPGEPDAVVHLTVTARKGFYVESKIFAVTVKAVSQDEIDAVNAELDAVEAALTFDAIRNANTAADAVTSNLQMVYRGLGYPGAITWATSNSGSSGIQITWATSDSSAVATYGTVTRPATADKNVTMTATLTPFNLVSYVTPRTVEIPIVVRKVSTSADVADITCTPSGGFTFAQETKSYDIDAEALADRADITVTTVESGTLITVKVGDQVIASARGQVTAAIPLTAGDTTAATVETEALDGAAADTYTLNIAREQPTDKDKLLAELLENLSQNVFSNTPDDWAAVSMSALGLEDDVAGKTVVENARAVYTSGSVTDLERAVIALTALGVNADQLYGGDEGGTAGQTLSLIQQFGNRASISQINEAIFGLIALDSGGYDDSGLTQGRQEYITYLLSNELTPAADEAAWAISGTTPGADITAMAVTALAPYYQSDSSVKTAVDGALAWLSAQQNADGSYGDANATAMAVIALSALGRDADTDSAFVKGGKSVLDGLLSFVTDDLQFGYQGNETANAMATEQGFRALAAYRGSLYAGGPYNVYQFAAPTGDGTELTGESNPNNELPDPNAPKQITVCVEDLYNGKTLMPATTVSVSGTHLDALKAALTENGYDPATTLNAAGGFVSSLLGVTMGSGTGWMYTLNGHLTSTLLPETRVAEGDVLTLFFINYNDSVYLTKFDRDQVTVTAGETLTLTLTGSLIDIWTMTENAYEPLSGATVYVLDASGREIGVSAVTNADGKVTLTFPSEGSYTVGARRAGSQNATDLVPPLCRVTVNPSVVMPADTGITVSLSVTGETSVVNTTQVTMPSGATAFDLLKKVLDERGIPYTCSGSGASVYIQSIAGLAEFAHGPTSGWTYSVNGVKPNTSAGAYQLGQGDAVAFIYVDDYTTDSAINPGGSQGGNGGESSTLKTGEHVVYLSGYPDGTVRADNTITRAEVASIFYLLLVNPGTASDGQFSDVPSGAWYAKAVNYLASIGILTGYPDGTFKPDVPMTRAEFAVIVSRFDGLASSGSGNGFSDVPSDYWALPYINSAYAKGWISGYPDGTFKPEGQITRAEAVTLINRMLDRSIDSAALANVANPYTDITPSHWAYADIIEASVAHGYTRQADGHEIWTNPQT